MQKVFHLKNPDLVSLFEPLIERAFAKGPAEPAAVRTELPDLLADPQVGVFVGVESGQPKALAIALAPSSQLFKPSVYHFYNEGPRELSGELISVVVAWFRDKGYTSFYGMNVTGRAEKLWRRTFRRAGNVVREGAVYRIDAK